MKIEHDLVPDNKCPVAFLREMGEQTKNSWIFLHRNVVKRLIFLADSHYIKKVEHIQSFVFKATDTLPEKFIRVEFDPSYKKMWLKIYRIDADDIAFNRPSNNPENIFFLKMAGQ